MGFGFCPRPLSAIGDERFTSQGSQQPPGAPLSREEGEAPPPTPAPEGRRRSRRVRLRGSCRHRPSLLGRRELATSAPVRPAPASSEVSEVGNNGARGSAGGRESRSSSLQRGPRARELRSGPEAPRSAGGPGSGRAASAEHRWIRAGGGGRAAFREALPKARAQPRTGRRLVSGWVVGGGKPTQSAKRSSLESWHRCCQSCDLGWPPNL